jgi:uncharacterized repeat protein (TIGR01451 family)
VIVHKKYAISALSLILFGAFAATASAAEEGSRPTSSAVAVKTLVEVVTRAEVDGREQTKVVPAEELVPGDEVIYTLEIRNPGNIALPPPVVDYRIPDHVRYVANSAVGAGAEVSYSVDQGHSFDRSENLKISGPNGEQRAASAADYTHIRWRLKHILKAKAVAMAHFRAVVK